MRLQHSIWLTGSGKTENFLTCWINALTIDNSLFPDTAEPLELLRNENPDHTVVLLLDLLCDKAKRDEKI